MKTKFFWYVLVLLAISLFVLSLSYAQPLLNVLVILLAICFYKYGDQVIFSEYNKKREWKKRQGEEINTATRTIIQEGRLFKKGSNE